MNRHQRDKNRANASALAEGARRARSMAHTCKNCGEPGGHWVQTLGQSLEDVLQGKPDQGFWTCPKYYGEDGRRLPEHIDPAAVGGLVAFVLAMHEFELMTPNV